jgi:multicomponent Na+:H+ antiporter subunit D
VLGAIMCLLQHNLKRMLAFATIAQVGLLLIGLGLLTADGTAGTALWVVGDGLAKAALFAVVAVVQHRHDRITERRLHGRGRDLWPLGLLFALAALTVASLPPTGSFLARSIVEDAALKLGGYGWVPALMAAVTAVVAGTLLRAAGRVFGGWGPPAPEDPSAEEGDDEDGTADEQDSPTGADRVLWGAAAALLVGAVVWGVWPGLRESAGAAAASFVDHGAYGAAVLDGARVTAHAPHIALPGVTSYLYAAASVIGALLVAGAGLAGWGGRLPRPLLTAATGLRRLHSGRPTDYVAWLAAGAAALSGTLAVLLT